MAGICCGLVGETETSAPIEPSSRTSRRRRLDLLPIKCIAADHMAVQSPTDKSRKRQKLDLYRSLSRDCENGVGKAKLEEKRQESSLPVPTACLDDQQRINTCGECKVENEVAPPRAQEAARFGSTSVCGRRRDMEDAVSIHPSLCQNNSPGSDGCHFYGVYDGHGCSHVSPLPTTLYMHLSLFNLNQFLAKSINFDFNFLFGFFH